MTNNSTYPDIGNVTPDNCPHCGSSFSKEIGKHSCHFDLETNGRTKVCLTAEALIRASNQNTELKTEIEQLKSVDHIVTLRAEVERLTKLTEECLNVIRVYCPTFYNDAMERFNKTHK